MKLLKELPEQTSHDFALATRKIISSHPEVNDDSLLEIAKSVQSGNVRFAAFYILAVKLWGRKDYTSHKKLIDEFRGDFATEPFFSFLEAEYYLSQAEDLNNARSAMALAETARVALPTVPGVQNLFAETIATIGEQHPRLIDSRDLATAESAIRRAQSLARNATQSGYAKYGANLARIQALQGHWSDARRSIARAIDTEDSSRNDYSLRVMGYELIRAKIDIAEQSGQLRNEQEVAVNEMRETRKDILQIMGLLAAVIAFLITTVNILVNFSPRVASSLLLVAAACILLVFLGFSSLYGRVKPGGALFSLLVSALLFGAGALLGAFQ